MSQIIFGAGSGFCTTGRGRRLSGPDPTPSESLVASRLSSARFWGLEKEGAHVSFGIAGVRPPMFFAPASEMNLAPHSPSRRNGTSTVSPNPADDLPPHSLEAEAGALGCLLHESPDTGQMIAQLAASDFYDKRHREIFSAIVALRDQGESIQPYTLQQRLKAGGILDSCGGAGYISGLPDQTPSAANFSVYLKTLTEHATRREFGRFEDQFRKAGRATDLNDAFEVLESAFFAWGERRKVSDLPAIEDASALTDRPHIAPPELVAGILHQGSKLCVGGGSKSCKTWVLAYLALCVSHGKRWLGLDTIKRSVLFVNFEIQTAFFADRLRVIAGAMGIELKPGLLDVWNLRGKSADAQTIFPKLKARIKGRDYGLVILDPIYKLYGATDENSAGDVARLLNQIEGLAVSTGAAVAFGAHFSKGNQAAKEAIDRVSGSGVFARDPDSLLMLTPLKERNSYAVETILRNFPPMDPFAVRFDFPLMIRANELNPSDLKQPGRKKEYDDKELVDLLREAPLTCQEWQEAAKRELGMSQPTFHRARRRLMEAARVIKSKASGKWTMVTKKGLFA